jgi:hypothetical protein
MDPSNSQTPNDNNTHFIDLAERHHLRRWQAILTSMLGLGLIALGVWLFACFREYLDDGLWLLVLVEMAAGVGTILYGVWSLTFCNALIVTRDAVLRGKRRWGMWLLRTHPLSPDGHFRMWRTRWGLSITLDFPEDDEKFFVARPQTVEDARGVLCNLHEGLGLPIDSPGQARGPYRHSCIRS